MSAALFTWDASPTTPIDGYNVYLEKDGVVTKVNSSVITETQYRVTNLSPGTYSVAYDTATRNQNESDPSNKVSFTIEFNTLYKPEGLSDSVTGSDVDLSWDYVPGIQQYNVYLDSGAGFVKQNTSLLNVNEYSITGLSSGDYDWKVSSVYDGEEVDSEIETFTIA
jgi:hypothetical protein